MKAIVAWSRIDTEAEGWPYEDVEAIFDNPEAVIEYLRSVQVPEEAPPLAIIRRENDDTLAIGIGTPIVCPDDEDDEEISGEGFTVLNYARADNLPPTYTSSTDSAFPGTLTFWFSGSDSEFGGDAAIRVEDAYEAVREFFTSTDRPSCIGWQMD